MGMQSLNQEHGISALFADICLSPSSFYTLPNTHLDPPLEHPSLIYQLRWELWRLLAQLPQLPHPPPDCVGNSSVCTIVAAIPFSQVLGRWNKSSIFTRSNWTGPRLSEPLSHLISNTLFVCLFITRLHVQSITCSSRSSSTSASWPRPCLWSSSHPLHIYLCTPLQANQPWITFHPIPRLLAYLTCRPKSNSLHRTPLLLIPLVCTVYFKRYGEFYI